MSYIWLYVAIGGFAGAVSRYAVIQLLSSRFSTAFPYGTLAVNIIGSFALGYLIGLQWDVEFRIYYAALGIGYLGSFTTFSTYAYDGLQMTMGRRWVVFLIYQIVSYGVCIGAAALGFLSSKSLMM